VMSDLSPECAQKRTSVDSSDCSDGAPVRLRRAVELSSACPITHSKLKGETAANPLDERSRRLGAAQASEEKALIAADLDFGLLQQFIDEESAERVIVLAVKDSLECSLGMVVTGFCS
jgi:hypothetical protein